MVNQAIRLANNMCDTVNLPFVLTSGDERVTSDNNETVKQEEHNTAITTNNVQREKPQNSFSHNRHKWK